MTDPKHIPHLVKLLDDDSETIQEKILQELAAFGPTLKQEIQKLNFKLNSTQRYYLDIVLQGQKRINLRRLWPNWLAIEDDYDRLEAGLGAICEFLSNSSQRPSLTGVLNSLAFSYRVRHGDKDARLLAEFLFKEKGLIGNEDDYYNPQNSNLSYVVRHKKGIPISLAVIYMLVGHRLGIDIEGCHFPGHFLAKIYEDDKPIFIDCFGGGQIMTEEDILNFREDLGEDIDGILTEKVNSESIVRRFLANLIRSYQIQEDEDNCQLMIDLFKDLEFREEQKLLKNIKPEDFTLVPGVMFKPGEVVYHRTYGYRGVVVEIDEECYATDDWYYGNQSQPDRHQPWLHVLVDGSEQVTYVAQSSLTLDESKEKIEHPLISQFFTVEADGTYSRNENPWPETDF